MIQTIFNWKNIFFNFDEMFKWPSVKLYWVKHNKSVFTGQPIMAHFIYQPNLYTTK